MAFSTIIRRSASSVAPVAARIISGQRRCHTVAGARFSALKQAKSLSRQFRPATYFSGRSFSTNVESVQSSDQRLLKVLDDEIKCAEETDEQEEVEEAPEGFPFKIVDKPGEQTITLSREYQGETITVEVSMPGLITGEEDDNDDEDENSNPGNNIPLIVNVAKKNGPEMEFGVTAYADEIVIDSISLKNPDSPDDEIAYEGPDFSDLDENLQTAFVKYLEIRGIKPSTTNFLHRYMVNKDSREYLRWLNNLKNFVKA